MNDTLKKVRNQRKTKGTKRRRPSRVLRVLAALVAVVALGSVAFGARSLLLSEHLRVGRLDVEGGRRISADALREPLLPLLGKPILLLDLDHHRRTIERLPGVAHATLARRLPDLLELRIAERVPVARLELGRRALLVDAEGELFPRGPGLATDEDLPRILGLATGQGATRLSIDDWPALRALEAYSSLTGRQPPSGTVLDLSQRNRLMLRPGAGAPELWLDREHPETNLEKLFVWERQVIELARGRAIDLRFPERLTLVPQGNAGAGR